VTGLEPSGRRVRDVDAPPLRARQRPGSWRFSGIRALLPAASFESEIVIGVSKIVAAAGQRSCHRDPWVAMSAWRRCGASLTLVAGHATRRMGLQGSTSSVFWVGAPRGKLGAIGAAAGLGVWPPDLLPPPHNRTTCGEGSESGGVAGAVSGGSPVYLPVIPACEWPPGPLRSQTGRDRAMPAAREVVPSANVGDDQVLHRRGGSLAMPGPRPAPPWRCGTSRRAQSRWIATPEADPLVAEPAHASSDPLTRWRLVQGGHVLACKCDGSRLGGGGGRRRLGRGRCTANRPPQQWARFRVGSPTDRLGFRRVVVAAVPVEQGFLQGPVVGQGSDSLRVRARILRAPAASA